MTDLMNELKSRPIAQKRALMTLYQHPNPQVRCEAAFATPQAADARRMIKSSQGVNR